MLESLEKQSFAIIKLGKPVKYIAVKPKIIIEKLKTNALRNADEKVKILSNLKTKKEYLELEQLYTVGIEPVRHEDVSGAIKGKSTIYNHIREILENAEKEVIMCTTTQEILNKPRFFSTVFEKLNKQGIKIKIALSFLAISNNFLVPISFALRTASGFVLNNVGHAGDAKW